MKNKIMLLAAVSLVVLSGESEGMNEWLQDYPQNVDLAQSDEVINTTQSTLTATGLEILNELSELQDRLNAENDDFFQSLTSIVETHNRRVTGILLQSNDKICELIGKYKENLKLVDLLTESKVTSLINDTKKIQRDVSNGLSVAIDYVNSATHEMSACINKSRQNSLEWLSKDIGKTKAKILDVQNEHDQMLNAIKAGDEDKTTYQKGRHLSSSSNIKRKVPATKTETVNTETNWNTKGSTYGSSHKKPQEQLNAKFGSKRIATRKTETTQYNRPQPVKNDKGQTRIPSLQELLFNS